MLKEEKKKEGQKKEQRLVELCKRLEVVRGEKMCCWVNLPFNLFQTDCKEGVRSYSFMAEGSESEAMRSEPPHIDQSSPS